MDASANTDALAPIGDSQDGFSEQLPAGGNLPSVVSDSSLCLSLIIATKGRAGPLDAALESAAKALPAGGEVIVVDGDRERSAEAVTVRVESRHPTLDLRYVTSTPGAAVQRNVGIDAARGDIVAFVDDDCTFEPGLFEALLAAYRDPDVVGATGHVAGGSSGSRLGSNPNSRLRRLALGGGRQGSMSDFGFRRPIVDIEQARDVEFMPGPLMSARRSAAAEVRFDERLAAYSLCEDDDFSFRLSRHGRIRYVPSAVVRHQELGWSRKDRRELDRIQVVNRAYLFRKNFPQTLRARAGFAALMAVLCGHRVLNREWSGLRGLLEGIGHVYRSRRTRTRPRAGRKNLLLAAVLFSAELLESIVGPLPLA
jgi:glycosyltransferase involved in cell wall biosynthesis